MLTTTPIPVLVFSPDGEYGAAKTSKERVLRETRLAARDYVVLAQGYSRLPKPALLVRDGCIVVSMYFVRAVVQPDRVVVFHSDNADVKRFAPAFAAYLRANRDDGPDFELRALEGILDTVAQRYSRRAALLTLIVDGVLKRLSTTSILQSFDAFHDNLLPMKDALSQFEIEATLIRNVLAETLKNNEDMVGMLLTERRRREGRLPPVEMHIPVELLLENYLSVFIDVAQTAYYLRKRVESSQSILELKLDAHRNRMMHLNLELSMMSIGLSFCTAGFGMFGMNLVSGLENTHSVLPFYWITILGVSSSFALYRWLHSGLRRDRVLAAGVEDSDSAFTWLRGARAPLGSNGLNGNGGAASEAAAEAGPPGSGGGAVRARLPATAAAAAARVEANRGASAGLGAVFRHLDEIQMLVSHDGITQREFMDAVCSLRISDDAAKMVWRSLDLDHHPLQPSHPLPPSSAALADDPEAWLHVDEEHSSASSSSSSTPTPTPTPTQPPRSSS